MQKINYLFTLFFLLIVSFSWAQNVNFRGTVTGKDTCEPVAGANVYLAGTTLGTVTKSDGSFELRNVKPGNYELIISCVGFHRVKENVTINNHVAAYQGTLVPSKSTLGEVVITGTGTPHHLKSAPVQTELIDNKLIKQIAAPNFTDLLTGISPSFDFTPGTMGSFMQLNGLGNDYILVLVDGKRVYGDIGGQSDLNRISPDDIERIEVVKGASSALYGSEAIAGVINVITKKSDQTIHVNNNSRFGENGEWQQHNNVDLNFGRFTSSTSFDHKESNGWQLSRYEQDDDELIETDAKAQDSYSDYTFDQKLSYSPTKKLNVYVQGTKFEHDLKKPLTVSNYGYYYDDFSYAAGAKYLLNKTDYIQADWNSDRFKYYYKYNQDYSDFTDGEKDKQTGQLRESFNLKGVFRLNKAQLLTAGGEYVSEELKSPGRLAGEKADAYTLAAYVQDEISILKQLSLVAGLRYVYHEEFGNALTPKISALYKIHDFNFRGTYARGFKAPTMKELYYHYEKRGYLYLGNPDLDPQTSDYYAASVEYIVQDLSFSLTAYQNDVKDLIDYQTVETSEEDAANGIKTTRRHYNIAEAGTQGIDFLFNANLGAGFTVGGGYSYVDAKNETDDIRLENVARNYGNLRLGYQRQWNKYRLNAGLSARFQDEKYYDDGNADGYNLWKLTTIHRFNTKGPFNFEVTGGIDNIFDYVDDSPYGSHYGTINPGRTFFAGINITFAR
ncbi:MAG: TonB-dependent receptor domain-containing protein [Mangrovibacterium sp.]